MARTRNNWWWDKLTRQQKEVFKLRQFEQYSREERDGEDIIVVIETRDYWQMRKPIISEKKYRVSPSGKITPLPPNDESNKDTYWEKIKGGNV